MYLRKLKSDYLEYEMIKQKNHSLINVSVRIDERSNRIAADSGHTYGLIDL
jgi:hypothetical protein